ncbi:PAS domain-containing protein [Bernardetia sp.]|uniref:PAS domain-containing protein n=1 Tax=Bernardetia sp. TaxID=1937974 RepID=UPI0025BB13FF|nr:PAS domain-containing protein [Bernardetia sp.]
MSEVITLFFDLLKKVSSLYIKIDRNNTVLQLVSTDGKLQKGFEDMIGKKIDFFLPENTLSHFTKAIFKTANAQSINSLTLNQALHTEMPFSLKFQFVPLENNAVGIMISAFKEDYISTSFYDKVPVMILYLDEHENILWANNHFYNKTQLEKDIIGANARDFLLVDTTISQRDSIRTKNPKLRTEYRLVGRKRVRMNVIVSAVEQQDDEGNYLCTTVVVRDITEPKKLQTELEYQKAALDEAAIVGVTDVRGNIVYVNDKFCEVSQYNREELMGQNHRMVKSDVHPPEVFEEMWATIYSGKVWRGEVCNKKKDGSLYWVYTTIIPFLNEIGKPFRYQAIRFEITERKRMEEQIIKYNEHLEALVEERTEELTQQTENLHQANIKLSTINKKIKKKSIAIQQSINYAQRIQDAILPNTKPFPSFIKDYFVFFQPRDIVSGDFYWWHTDLETETLFLAAVDCTGHGVPGAFMSMIGTTLLDDIIKTKKIYSPADILRELRIEVSEILHQEATNNRDGMDMAFLKIDFKDKTVRMAGAKNGVLIVKGKEVDYIKGDRISIGGRTKNIQANFTEHSIPYTEGTRFYLFSDGYQDQFAGKKGLGKFSSKRLKQLLAETSSSSMDKQKEILEKTLSDWKAKTKQIDDILVMGIELG